MTVPLLELRQLRVALGGREVLHGLDLQVQPRQMVALIGESGSGKSVSAHALAGLLPQHARVQGQVLFEGRDLLRLAPQELRALRGNALSLVFQDSSSSLHPMVPVGVQVGEVLRVHQGLSAQAARAQTLELLDLVGLREPALRYAQYPHQFSGGMRQRAMIAMAVACRPRLLIADEPTTALDTAVQQRVLALLGRLRTELSMAVLLITHDLGIVAEHADRVCVLRQGCLVEEAATAALFARPAQPYTRALVAATLGVRGRHYRSARLAGLDETPAVPAPWSAAARPAAAGAPALRVRGLVAGHDGAATLRGVSLEIGAGETLGLIGESGSGKSTLCKAILGLLPLRAGAVEIGGRDPATLPRAAARRLRQGVQMVFQNPYAAIQPRRRVRDSLHEALHASGLPAAQRQRAIDALWERVGLEASLQAHHPHELSGGQLQRACIARALLLQPRLLILDEPVSALDVGSQARVLNLLADLKHEHGLAYLFISHDPALMRYMSDRVLTLRAGVLEEEAAPAAPRAGAPQALTAAAA